MKFGFISKRVFMQISFFAKIVLFLALYCISDLSIKKNILRNVLTKASSAKKV
tara:strand:- start:760 stop:918 length:159 start_codon:yes stop_codon:yes gene_type:complete